LKMPFGRYRGEELSALPWDYIVWLSGLDLRPPLLHAVEEEMARRADGSMLDPATAQAAERILTAGYRIASLEAHPDRGGSHEEMVSINAAAGVLRGLLARIGARRAA
jgi:Putative quorum-sensing-regulated virulence factor